MFIKKFLATLIPPPNTFPRYIADPYSVQLYNKTVDLLINGHKLLSTNNGHGPFMGNFAAGFSSIMMGGGAAPPNMGYGSGGYGGGGQFGMHGQQGHNQQGGGYGYGGAGGGDYGGPGS